MVAKMRHSAALLQDAGKPSRDPTGTLDIRTRYKTLIDQRWRKFLRYARAVIIDQDMMGLENKVQQTPLGMAMNALPPDSRVRAFQSWVDTTLNRVVLENDAAYLDPMVQGTYNRAIKRAMRLTNSTAIPGDGKNVVAHLQQLSLVELQGIDEAVSQRVVRLAANATLDRVIPAELYRQVVVAVQQVGMTRTRALVEVMVAKTHSTATLDQFAAAGVKRVGLIPESMPGKRLKDAARPVDPAPARRGTSASTIGRIAREEARVESKFKAEEVEVLTAGDDLVCPECEEISADGPYTIDEARSLIPAHPNCRCAFVPEGSPLFANLLAFAG
jgi:hypothetical protein